MFTFILLSKKGVKGGDLKHETKKNLRFYT